MMTGNLHQCAVVHQQHHHSPKPPSSSHSQPFPANPISDSRSQRVDALSQGARALPPSMKPGTKIDEPSKERPKFSVKFFLHSCGQIAAKFQNDQVIIAAFRRIPRASWNAKERLWMFPPSSLSEAEKYIIVDD
ncbi:hypothetical protein PIB30_081922 [Stylosanthes scabra]|uniref:Uncharacterized protein n=1 Tax=Stylosanthes scabra TaxID=79078 RepID=A0ABU6TRD9_9FABA|nr:hypothetical protein [Stylosanthes scabra]